jgi:hypothetical protein
MGLLVALIGPNHSPHGGKCLKRLQVVAVVVAVDEEDQARAAVVEVQPVWLLPWHLRQHMLSSRIILGRLELVLWLSLLAREALDLLGLMNFELVRTLPVSLYGMW